MNLCSIENCNKNIYALNVCREHYDKVRRTILKSELLELKKEYYKRHKDSIKSRINKYAKTDLGKFKKAIRNAAAVNKEWTLTFDQYIQELANRKCHYCGGELSKEGSGLDRKNNSIGYIVGNCVPCCYTCNTFKRNLLSYKEMLEIIKLLKQIRSKEEIWT